jgi:ParB family transcriptional regulator, chromosome partitioning protein
MASMKDLLAQKKAQHDQSTQDSPAQSSDAQHQPKVTATLPLEQITERPGGDTRPLTQSHVESLAESIAAVGLIQPIAVDGQGRLLAGGHRLAAIEYLQATDQDSFNQWFSQGVPIRQYGFDAEQEPELALAIEATENEKRRDYTPVEVRELADRLKSAGYNYTSGRPAKGQKSLIPSLSVIVGKSDKTIRRYLSDPQQKSGHMTGLSTTSKSMTTASPTSEPKSGHMTGLSTIDSTTKALHRLIASQDIPDEVQKLAEKLLKKLEQLN